MACNKNKIPATSVRPVAGIMCLVNKSMLESNNYCKTTFFPPIM